MIRVDIVELSGDSSIVVAVINDDDSKYDFKHNTFEVLGDSGHQSFDEPFAYLINLKRRFAG